MKNTSKYKYLCYQVINHEKRSLINQMRNQNDYSKDDHKISL